MTLPPGLQAVRERATEMNAKSFRGEPWLMMTVILILVTFVPEIGLFLPRLAGLL